MNTLPGSPSARAGFAAGMLIQKVDDTSLAGLPLADCIHLIRGPVGSTIRLEVVDPEQKSVRSVQLIRERVQVDGPR
jgi:C-terminal processing protease CtpA/Prc